MVFICAMYHIVHN